MFAALLLTALVTQSGLVSALQQKHIEEVIDASSKFSKVTEEKLIQKMETSLKNREDQIRHLMDRLKDHVSSSLCSQIMSSAYVYQWGAMA